MSLTSPIGKILESFIRDQVQTYMESNNLLSNCQHGFRKSRSCITQLLQVMNDITRYIEDHKDIDIIYLDFSKAFDTVPHQRLINKLKAYSINGKLLKWITDFLNERKQRVRVNSSYSSYSTIDSGNPHGFIIDPILFIIFINDLPENVACNCKIFC